MRLLLVCLLAVTSLFAQPKGKVVIFSVNGGEWDVMQPLLASGQMPNLQGMIDKGVSAKLNTLSHAVCPKVYSTFFTGESPEVHNIPGFFQEPRVVTSTKFLKGKRIWEYLNEKDITVGMFNVPGTWPVEPVNGYMVSGMLVRGLDVLDHYCTGDLCSVQLSKAEPAAATPWIKDDLLSKFKDVPLDCSPLPEPHDARALQPEFVKQWLAGVDVIRTEQTKVIDYLLEKHPQQFNWFTASCEDRVGHWLYPVAPFNIGYQPELAEFRKDSFPQQYRAFDQSLGVVLKHIKPEDTVIVMSDHGIKTLRSMDEPDHHGSYVVAHHSFEDGSDVPGIFVAVGPRFKKGYHVNGLGMSVYDFLPTVLSLYGIPPTNQMEGKVFEEILQTR
jgi:predicted AlkP superfamily phosphohydrolase/phosphomutase